MKKIVIVLLFGLTMAMPVSAQYHRNPATGHVVSTGGYRSYNNNRENYRRSDNEVYYGLRLGVVSSTVNSDDQYLDGSDSKAGLNIGAVLGYQLNPSVPLYLETGLYYTEKGGKGHVSGAKFTYNLDYLEVPIVVKYKAALDNDFSVQPYFGGYFALGVGGKVKNFGARSVYDSFGSDDDQFQHFDGGLKLGCGISYNVLYADINYEWGLTNICHDTFDASHNRVFYFNIGVDF